MLNQSRYLGEFLLGRHYRLDVFEVILELFQFCKGGPSILLQIGSESRQIRKDALSPRVLAQECADFSAIQRSAWGIFRFAGNASKR